MPRPIVTGLSSSNSIGVRQRVAAFLEIVWPVATARAELDRMLAAEDEAVVRRSIRAGIARLP